MMIFFYVLDVYYYYYGIRHNIFQLTYILVCDVRKKLCGLQVYSY